MAAGGLGKGVWAFGWTLGLSQSVGLGLVAAPPTVSIAPGCSQPQVVVWITRFLLTLRAPLGAPRLPPILGDVDFLVWT